MGSGRHQRKRSALRKALKEGPGTASQLATRAMDLATGVQGHGLTSWEVGQLCKAMPDVAAVQERGTSNVKVWAFTEDE